MRSKFILFLKISIVVFFTTGVFLPCQKIERAKNNSINSKAANPTQTDIELLNLVKCN